MKRSLAKKRVNHEPRIQDLIDRCHESVKLFEEDGCSPGDADVLLPDGFVHVDAVLAVLKAIAPELDPRGERVTQ